MTISKEILDERLQGVKSPEDLLGDTGLMKELKIKLIYLAIRNFEKDGRNVREWFAARNQFAIMFGERFEA